MRFIDFDLYDAIHDVRNELQECGEPIGSDRWISDESYRSDLCKRVIHKMHKRIDQDIIDAWVAFRKRAKAEGTDVNKLALTIEVARLRGRTCFYADRGLGHCSDDVQLERIIPGARGGVYSLANCIIACGSHNASRNDLVIEEYLASAMAPVCVSGDF